MGRSETSDLDVSEEENAKRAEQMRRPSGHQAKGEVVYEHFPVSLNCLQICCLSLS